jgi:hypothetical protein
MKGCGGRGMMCTGLVGNRELVSFVWRQRRSVQAVHLEKDGEGIA